MNIICTSDSSSPWQQQAKLMAMPNWHRNHRLSGDHSMNACIVIRTVVYTFGIIFPLFLAITHSRCSTLASDWPHYVSWWLDCRVMAEWICWRNDWQEKQARGLLASMATLEPRQLVTSELINLPQSSQRLSRLSTRCTCHSKQGACLKSANEPPSPTATPFCYSSSPVIHFFEIDFGQGDQETDGRRLRHFPSTW